MVAVPVDMSMPVVVRLSRIAVAENTVGALGKPVQFAAEVQASTVAVVPAPAVGTAASVVRDRDLAHGFAVHVTRYVRVRRFSSSSSNWCSRCAVQISNTVAGAAIGALGRHPGQLRGTPDRLDQRILTSSQRHRVRGSDLHHGT
jgi:hypothetical protein